MVEVPAAYSPRIDALTRILEAHQDQDPAVAAALRDCLDFGERPGALCGPLTVAHGAGGSRQSDRMSPSAATSIRTRRTALGSS
jgi:hypothetical protein